MREVVSMVCVTNRPHFADIVAAQYEAQTYPHKELVVIDSSEEGNILRDLADVHVVEEPGQSVGHLRNVGLEHAHGDWLMWFDDDDWRNPDLCTLLIDAAHVAGCRMAGVRSFFWIDVDGRMERRCCQNWPVFAGAVYHNDALPTFRQKTTRVCKTDSLWLLRVREKFDGFGVMLDKPHLFAWVNHGTNVFNRSYDTQSRDPTELDPLFMPDDARGLAKHMGRIRECLS